MFEVTVTAWFSAAHQLRLLDGSMEPLHGHNWRVVATLAGRQLDPMGVLVDFTQLKPALERIVGHWHDRNLNGTPEFERLNPSAENVALTVFRLLSDVAPPGAKVVCIEVEEAPGCVARYRPN